jgi:hypothetical protein
MLCQNLVLGTSRVPFNYQLLPLSSLVLLVSLPNSPSVTNHPTVSLHCLCSLGRWSPTRREPEETPSLSSVYIAPPPPLSEFLKTLPIFFPPSNVASLTPDLGKGNLGPAHHHAVAKGKILHRSPEPPTNCEA